MSRFIHLRTHSEYSLVDGLFRVKDLVAQVKAMEMPAVALTDESNLFALIKFYRAALAQGIQPIIGVDAWIRADHGIGRVTLLALNDCGYKNLLELLSLGWLKGQSGDNALLSWDWVETYAEGLICLTGATEGEIGRLVATNQLVKADQVLKRYHNLFQDKLYLELTRVGG